MWRPVVPDRRTRKNNCVQRKWESRSTKEVFLCCLAAGSHIKAAVNWSDICIFLPFFIVCIGKKGYTHRRLHSHTETHTLSQHRPFSSGGSLLMLGEQKGGGLFAALTAHAPSWVAKGRGQSAKGVPLSPWQHHSQGEHSHHCWGY